MNIGCTLFGCLTLVMGGASFLVMEMGRLAVGMFLGTMDGAWGFSTMELAAGRSDRSSGPDGTIIRLKRGGRSLTPPANAHKHVHVNTYTTVNHAQQECVKTCWFILRIS